MNGKPISIGAARLENEAGATIDTIFSMPAPESDQFRVWHATYVRKGPDDATDISATMVQTRAGGFSLAMFAFGWYAAVQQCHYVFDAAVWFGLRDVVDSANLFWTRDRQAEHRMAEELKQQKIASAQRDAGLVSSPVRGKY